MLFHCFLDFSSRIFLHLRESLTDIKQDVLHGPSRNPKVWFAPGGTGEAGKPGCDWMSGHSHLRLGEGWSVADCKGSKRKRWETGRLSCGTHSLPGLSGLQMGKGVRASRRKKLLSRAMVCHLAKAGSLWGPGENGAWRRREVSSP